ncbi:hypothetical protein FIBSPDRAFT_900123 [Athelia psychrophila]|uniref:F-box domain-containing protein n=1 Tax=Athelia psychrophila TaxID=1759441 RepID=A0A165YSU1_9AGAM|nr:hypothetical protein FIBSPDRAFT_900123 [Fibularhizoctonia sp. CBS 109695]
MLPTEVIENILQLADWKSILHARASCKRLDSVSRSLLVWREQYAALTALNPSTPRLECPLERYSSSELEKVVLQRGSVDAGWHSAMEYPISMRNIPFEKATYVETYLVDGGRWLLASAFGAVMVYDLDDPKDRGNLLIPRHADAHESLRTTYLMVDILADATPLVFNLAIGQDQREYPAPENTPFWTHIWRVALNGHGADAELRAVHLTSFTTPGDIYCMDASLHGHLYAKAFTCTSLGSCVEVYDWSTSSLREHRKAVMHNNDRCTCLPSSRHRGSKMIPCNSISLPGTKFVRGPSQLRYGLSAGCSFISCTNAGIFVVKLSGNVSSAHILHPIADARDVTDVLVGARRVYIRYYDFAEAFSYDTKQNGASDVVYCTTPPQKRFITKECIPYLDPKMDDVSGRVAMAASKSALVVFYYSQYNKYK